MKGEVKLKDTDVRIGIAGLIIIILIIVIAANFIILYTPALTFFVEPYKDTPRLLLSYRLFDIIFLSFLVFAAIVGITALFRPEKVEEEAV